MKRLGLLALAAMLLPMAAAAQGMAPNPITSLIKQQVARYSQLQVAAAEDMPADKYNYSPTAGMRSYGSLILHIAQFNDLMCSRLSGKTGPDTKGLKETDSKDKLVTAIKESFEFCKTTIDGLDDSTLGQSAGTVFGRMKVTRGSALVILAEDWFDHYGTQAVYLRLNGILPPSARHGKM
jgi:uncharacterized damage-inducible protein DinB